ncbi:unnamed protein product [Miscanthus lutarioriparius]|uniref:Uncharacterized protein n=1 Tax=Miscanthus lutarioriparius TaxID=422564 RepID=A0A811QPI0_9POAL|nr:unnamed protein product [Miscanthus lutarioriparius]
MSIPRAAHLLVLLSVLAANSLSSGAAAAALPVYDTEGHGLSADADYYVLPAPRGSGGGLTMAPNGLRCPLFVSQETDPLRKGFPVRFTPLPQKEQQQGGNGDDRTVRVNSDVGVHFAAVTTCVQTTEWHVSGGGDAPAPLLPSGRHRLVLTGPVRSPSPNGREKVFRVEKHGRGGYKLVWCGGAGGSTSSCQDLGVFRDDGDRRAWLGTAETDRAHVVVFEKAATVHA